jgi:hypothetical protein
MKFFYPRFLKTNPSFIGLSIIDLFILVGALAVAVLFNLGSFGSLLLIVISIGIFKVVALKFPPQYFSLFFTKFETLRWKTKLREVMNGVLV